MMIKKAKRKHLTKTQRLRGNHLVDLEGDNDRQAAGPWPRQRTGMCRGHERTRHMSQSRKWRAHVARASGGKARVIGDHRGDLAGRGVIIQSGVGC